MVSTLESCWVGSETASSFVLTSLMCELTRVGSAGFTAETARVADKVEMEGPPLGALEQERALALRLIFLTSSMSLI